MINKASKHEEFKKNSYGDQYLYSVNRNTFTKDSASNIYKKHFSGQLNIDETFYLIFGTDSGLLPQFLMKQDVPSNTRYLFIELPHLLDKVLSTLPNEYDSEAFSFTTLDKWEAKANELELSIYIHKDNLRYIKSFAALDAYIPEYHTSHLKIIRALEATFFFTRALVGVFPFMTKQLVNISENVHSSSLMNNLFKGKTCVILGGGPSLDNDIEWIKANQKNLVIIAVSRIAKLLLNNDLTPHIIVSVDPYDISFDVSKELLKLPKKVLFLHANCVNPNILAQWHGKGVYIGERFPWADEANKNSSIMGGPTVTNAALKSAIEMGFSNILLSGVDLCYAKNGVTHASGSNESQVGPTLGKPGVWVENYAGNTAETTIAFDNAVLALSQQALAAKDNGVSIYNLSENAAKAKNITHVPTSALSFEDEKDDIWQLIHSTIPEISHNFVLSDHKVLLTKVSKMLKNIQTIKKLACEALDCNKKLFQEKGKESENYKYKLRMDKIEKKLDTRHKLSVDFIKCFGLDKFIKSAQTSHDDWSDEKIEQTGNLYYQAYVDSCTTLVTLLQTTVKRIKSRIEEEKPQPNFQTIFEQWQADKHFGRARVWQECSRHTSINIPEAIQNQFIKFNEQFEQEMNNKDTFHMARTKKEASLEGVKRKIIILFKQHNIDGLQVLSNSLQQYNKSNEQAKKLYLLANAYYLALKESFSQSLACFEKLPESELSDDEYQQITTLAIKLLHYEKAEAALEKLAKASSVYAPQYAKILALLNKYEKSIDIYTQYLSENADDIATWFALGKLYFDSNAIASADMAFKYILMKDPNHISAQDYIKKINASK